MHVFELLFTTPHIKMHFTLTNITVPAVPFPCVTVRYRDLPCTQPCIPVHSRAFPCIPVQYRGSTVHVFLPNK
jgi:hypothetical protein